MLEKTLDMHEFRDTKDRTWKLEINVDSIEQVKEQCGINLLDMADPDSGLMREINAFPPLVGKLLFAAVADQAKTKEVDEREFKRSMSGDCLSLAIDALLEEIVLFFPKHRRSLLLAVLDKNREVEQAGTDLMLTRLADPELKEQALAAMDRRVKLQIAEALSDLGPAPAASGSSPTAGPPPDFSASLAPDHTPGDDSSGSPTAPGDLIAG